MNPLSIRCIQLYRLFIAPLLHQFSIIPGGCRFYPTCSGYGLEALRQYGLAQGFMFLLGRLGRCHPWSSGGYDPVPYPVRDRGREGSWTICAYEHSSDNE